jgi:hypothetical protein
LSPAKIRIRSSSSERKKREEPARAPAQLIVDASRLVTLRAEYVQAAAAHDILVLLLDERLDVGHRLFELLLRSLLGVDLLPLEMFAREEFGVAAEQDIGAASGHVGGDGYRALAARLRDNLGLALVVLGVQDVMVVRNRAVALDENVSGLVAVAYARLRESARDEFRVLDRDRADQHGLARLVALDYLLDDGVPLLGERAVDKV